MDLASVVEDESIRVSPHDAAQFVEKYDEFILHEIARQRVHDPRTQRRHALGIPANIALPPLSNAAKTELTCSDTSNVRGYSRGIRKDGFHRSVTKPSCVSVARVRRSERPGRVCSGVGGSVAGGDSSAASDPRFVGGSRSRVTVERSDRRATFDRNRTDLLAVVVCHHGSRVRRTLDVICRPCPLLLARNGGDDAGPTKPTEIQIEGAMACVGVDARSIRALSRRSRAPGGLASRPRCRGCVSRHVVRDRSFRIVLARAVSFRPTEG